MGTSSLKYIKTVGEQQRECASKCVMGRGCAREAEEEELKRRNKNQKKREAGRIMLNSGRGGRKKRTEKEV